MKLFHYSFVFFLTHNLGFQDDILPNMFHFIILKRSHYNCQMKPDRTTCNFYQILSKVFSEEFFLNRKFYSRISTLQFCLKIGTQCVHVCTAAAT